MALAFPRQPVVEFWLDRWRDVSTDVRQSPAMSITPGRKDWASKLSPATCKFTLDDGPDHGDGDYHPENPLGQWFGLLDRNVPVRVGLAVMEDTFTRTVVNGWGTAPTGEVWTNVGGVGGTVQASDWQATGTAATHSVPAANGYRYSTMAQLYRDVEIAVSITVAVSNITGGAIEPGNLILRRSGGSYYMTRVSIDASEVLTISIHHSTGGQLVAPVTVAGLVDAVSSKVIRVKMQAEGQTLRAKVYAPGAEPLGWHVEVHDTTITTAGEVGIRNGVSSGNTNTKPIVFSVDDFTVALPRFFGETSSMVPLSTVGHKDQRTTVECASIRRRLSKGERKLGTALERYIARGDAPFGVSDFWPLDYELDATNPGANAVGPSPARFFQVTGGALKWGTDTGLLPVERGVTLTPPGTGHSGQMLAYTDSTKFTAATGYGAVWLQRLGSDRTAAVVIGLTTNQLFLEFLPGQARLTLLPAATVVMTVGMPQIGDDTVWHMIGVGARQSGTSAVFSLVIDSDHYQTTLTTTTVGVPLFIDWAAYPETVDGYEITQALLMTSEMLTGSPWYIDQLRDIYLGRVGETAGDRFERLCLEEEVSSALVGDPADTPAMGPQRPLSLLTLLDECVEVAQGSPFDPRGAAALGLRTLRATAAQGPAVTLDYAGKQVSATFGPVRDDQGTLNDVTSKRPNGGEYRVEQLTGPRNVNDPGTATDAVGRVAKDAPVNVETDPQLIDQAGWRVHMGTAPGPRYPTVTVDLAADEFLADAALTQAVLDVGVDDALTITNAQLARIYDDVRLIARGYTETLDTAFQHQIVFNTTPASPYDIAIYDAPGVKYDSDTSATASSFVAGTGTSLSVATTGGTLWTLRSGAWPFQIAVFGVVLNVTAVSGTSSPQTLTVDATPVNGVAKTIPAGKPVRLARPVYMIP